MTGTFSVHVRNVLETSSSDSQSPPVTWQVLFWTLSALAISSMTQPSGRWCGQPIPRKYRLYICISPLMCLADALSMVLGVILTRYMFPISILNAVRFVDFWRSEPDISEEVNEIERPNPRSGSRWVLFIIGTLPALIKIVSFSGVPWSRTWGLMFGSSYLLIELVNMVSSRTSQEPFDSVATALGYSKDRWDLDINRGVRMRAELLDEGLFTIGFLARHLAIVAQAILAMWVVFDLRRLIPGTLLEASHVDNPVALLSLPFLFMYLSAAGFAIHHLTSADRWRWPFRNVWNGTYIRLVSISNALWQQASSSAWGKTVIRIIARLISWWQRLSSTSWCRTFMRKFSYHIEKVREARRDIILNLCWTLVLNTIGPFVGSKDRNALSYLVTNNTVFLPIFFLLVIGFLAFAFLGTLCRMVPLVGRALQVMRSMEIADDVDESSFRKVDVVDWDGAVCITFFCLHFFLGTTWYAKMYNPLGTANVSWTSVFG